jgi:hypothetical protein
MHLITSDRKKMGHLEEVMFRKRTMKLYLPTKVLTWDRKLFVEKGAACLNDANYLIQCSCRSSKVWYQ